MIDFEVYDKRPNDSDLLVPAIEIHQATLCRTPHLVAADVAFHSGKNEATARAKGVKRVCIPNRSTKSADANRRSAGSATVRNGVPDAKVVSAW
jgi:IS5 family transposase